MLSKRQGCWLILSHMFPTEMKPAFGRFVEDHALAIRSEGSDVLVVTCEFTSAHFFRPLRFLKEALKSAVQAKLVFRVTENGTPHAVFFCPALGLGAGIQAILYTLALSRVEKKIRAVIGNVEIIHAHTSLYDGLAARMLASRWKLPYIITEHTGPFSMLTNSILKRALTGYALSGAKKIVAVSSYLKSKITEVYPRTESKVEVIPNPIDVDVFRPRNRDRSGQLDVIGWLGHFDPVKRVDRLLEAFEVFKTEHPSAKLHLIGNGEFQNQVIFDVWSKRLEGAVEIVAAASRSEVAKSLAEIDVLVVASEVETFSVATVEALACGIPVIATDCGGPVDILANEELGIIVEQSSSGILEGLKKMSTGIVGTAEGRQEYASRKYSWSAVALQYIRLVERVRSDAS